jgi:dynactin complex subunit
MNVTIEFKEVEFDIEFNYLAAIEEDDNFGTPEVIEILKIEHNGGDITLILEHFEGELKEKISQYLNN